MKPQPVILIFDVGKTNKKILLFDEQYRLVYEESVHLEEITDEDGFPCEDIKALTTWIRSSFTRMLKHELYDVQAVNFSAYGASFVYVDADLKPVLPLYNYLKPYPADLQDQFYTTHGGRTNLAMRTASPVLGSLNSGMQLYRLKKERNEAFNKIKYALHLPQYLSAILTQTACTEITSLGCHTHLWDFRNNDYHKWVVEEALQSKFPSMAKSDACIRQNSIGRSLCVGIGLHDSSAALIPYLLNFSKPFILLSTGTWCISLNPFNNTGLTQQELESDCLCYLTYEGKPVKASRLFAGYEHEQQTKRLAEHFHLAVEEFTDPNLTIQDLEKIKARVYEAVSYEKGVSTSFAEKDLRVFNTVGEAYQELIVDIVTRQFAATRLVERGTDVKRIFVDGGFSKNSIYMHLLAAAFPDVEVYAASIPQASALGAALVIHGHWNKYKIPPDIIALKCYSGIKGHPQHS